MEEIKKIAKQIGGYRIVPIPNPTLIRFMRDDNTVFIDIWPRSLTIGVCEKGQRTRYHRDCTMDDFTEFLLSPTTYRVK